MSTAYLFLAPGFEETEALLPTDLLRRAGIDVTLVATTEDIEPSLLIEGSNGIKVTADISVQNVEINSADALILPGGLPGADNLAKNNAVISLIETQLSRNKLLAAICAAPVRVLGANGFLKNRKYTCYPGFESELSEGNHISDKAVVKDRNLITSKGIGTAAHFAYTLICELKDETSAQKVWDGTVISTQLPYPNSFE